jgi:hypothetical protein
MMWLHSTRGRSVGPQGGWFRCHHRWRDCIAQTHAGIAAMAACSSVYGPTENGRCRLTKMRSNVDLLQTRRFELKYPRLHEMQIRKVVVAP